MGANWKTTVTGILTIIVAITTAALTYFKTGAFPDVGALVALIMTGIGLITAKDSNVTGGSVEQ